MKQTVKTSRAAGQLEKMFRELNKHYFAGKLPEPIISLKKTPSAYGHITCSKVWQAGGENKYEINISSATLDRPIEETASTLLHEIVHEYCMETGIKDTSNNGVYHNRRFKEQAEAHGLTVDHHEKYGWTITSPSEELLDFIIFQTSVYKGYKQDKIEMRGDRAEMSDFPLYLNTVAGGLDRRDQTIGGFSFVVKIYAVPVVEIIGQLLYLLGRYGFNTQFGDCL